MNAIIYTARKYSVCAVEYWKGTGESMAVLVTGGLGYIGSHTVIQLLDSGKDVVIIDNLSNSVSLVLDRIAELAQGDLEDGRLVFYEADLLNLEAVDKIFEENTIESVIHFAGLKAVGESVAKPIAYYENNIGSTLNLLKCMDAYDVKELVFSSSATVYGLNNVSPLHEKMPLSSTNPYGETKVMIERILTDWAHTDDAISVLNLRYFNPIGAHESGRIGENPTGIPNNLMPYITQVAVGMREQLNVFGDDYDTVDGTGVRDYIHVQDLARGHVLALDYVSKHQGVDAVNLGAGQGVSVFELVHAFEKASNITIPYKVVERRPGDIATCFASVDKAKDLLGFEVKYTVDDMCRDSWNWQKNNPKGYVS